MLYCKVTRPPPSFSLFLSFCISTLFQSVCSLSLFHSPSLSLSAPTLFLSLLSLFSLLSIYLLSLFLSLSRSISPSLLLSLPLALNPPESEADSEDRVSLKVRSQHISFSSVSSFLSTLNPTSPLHLNPPSVYPSFKLCYQPLCDFLFTPVLLKLHRPIQYHNSVIYAIYD